MKFEMNKTLVVAGTLAATMAVTAAAYSDILQVSQDVIVNGVPDVRLHQTQNDFNINAFLERDCFALQNALATDQGVLPAGAMVECHYLHFDPVNNNFQRQGKVRFDAPIVGTVSTSAGMDAADQECDDPVAPAPIYPVAGAEPLRGLEAGTPDALVIVNPVSVAVRMHVVTSADNARVITMCGAD